MTPDDLRITRWLQASREALPTPDPGRILPDVLARIADTPQAGRRSRRPSPSTRRFTSMLTPLRLAAFASLVVLGAVSVTVTGPGTGPNLVASPSPSPAASAPAVALPVPFQGRILFGNQVTGGTTTFVGGVLQDRASVHAPVVRSMTDPRLEGDALISWQTDSYLLGDGTRVVVGTGTWRIENAGGAWTGSYTDVDKEDFTPSNKVVLTGEGAYEGLVAIWQEQIDDTGWDVSGYIFSAPVPPVATLP